MKKLLFVCLGNICRSPAAEAVMTQMIANRGLDDRVRCDSAGTAAYHSGEPADARMQKHGERRGYRLTSISRKVYPDSDFPDFDMILTMDPSNYNDIAKLAKPGELDGKLFPMTQFCREQKVSEVPDPYYGGEAGFEQVYDILEDACANLLDEIAASLKA